MKRIDNRYCIGEILLHELYIWVIHIGYQVFYRITLFSRNVYEIGFRDITPAAPKEIISIYCNFPMYELFPKDESKLILDTFATAVTITVERKKRQERIRKMKADRSAILRQAGQEVFEPVAPKKRKTLREQYKDVEIYTEYPPYNESEFMNYVTEKKEGFILPIVSAGQFLHQIEDQTGKETLKGMIADYIVDELVIEGVARKQPDETSKRVYAYYRMLYLDQVSKIKDNDVNENERDVARQNPN